jgi:hypothetical protein
MHNRRAQTFEVLLRSRHRGALCSAPHNASYVSENVMWPWPMGAADHTGRYVDRSHITEWAQMGLSSSPLDRGRLSWRVISARPKIADSSGSISSGRM